MRSARPSPRVRTRRRRSPSPTRGPFRRSPEAAPRFGARTRSPQRRGRTRARDKLARPRPPRPPAAARTPRRCGRPSRRGCPRRGPIAAAYVSAASARRRRGTFESTATRPGSDRDRPARSREIDPAVRVELALGHERNQLVGLLVGLRRHPPAPPEARATRASDRHLGILRVPREPQRELGLGQRHVPFAASDHHLGPDRRATGSR